MLPYSRRLIQLVCVTLWALPQAALPAVGYGNPEISSAFPMKDTAERKGDRATMIVLFSYKRMKTGYVTNQSKPKVYYYSSSKAKVEFDCRRKKSRIIGTVFFSDRAGVGNVVHEQTVSGAWSDENDRRPQESHFSMACEPARGEKS